MSRPEFLSHGSRTRLFPVLTTTSKEGRATSIFLACFEQIAEMSNSLLTPLGQKVGPRSTVQCFTEIVFKSKDGTGDRPDGLIILKTGQREWKALLEAKIGKAEIDADQVERYRVLAKAHGIDCVITISNQFATSPSAHPNAEIRKSRSKIPVFHWSWMSLLTTSELLINGEEIGDQDHRYLINELRRFLAHESTGVTGFERMPSEWSELNKLVAAGGKLSPRSEVVSKVLDAWHQETRDLSLILSRQTETGVREKLSRKHISDPSQRQKDETAELCNSNVLKALLEIQGAAAPLEIVADAARRAIDVGMSIKAPDDRKSAKARANWLLRQIKGQPANHLHIRANWPGRVEASTFSYCELSQDVGAIEKDNEGRTLLSFHIYYSVKLGGRFAQQTNFISEIEKIVPDFYKDIGQHLVPWQAKAPKIRESKDSAEEVSTESISDAAEREIAEN